ncbi:MULTISPECIES: SGNH/GDSL hydrolase family protein [Rathayibacter]|nr:MULTISPECIES: SGNH/GDSL hydrolase family protein [Rathayibacter]
MSRAFASYAAIGDSFAEGLGGDRPDGSHRGWADLVAHGLVHASTTTVTHANLAIRGKLLDPLLAEQLEPAITLRPELLSISGGNNDIIRPTVSITANLARLEVAIDRAVESGIHVVFVTVANMTRHLPLGHVIETRGDRFALGIQKWDGKDNVTVVDNWFDETLYDLRFWAPDRLHLNTAGHLHAARKIPAALGVEVQQTLDPVVEELRHRSSGVYWRELVQPWIGRRVTGRSSGDGRRPKSPTMQPVVTRAGATTTGEIESWEI